MEKYVNRTVASNGNRRLPRACRSHQRRLDDIALGRQENAERTARGSFSRMPRPPSPAVATAVSFGHMYRIASQDFANATATYFFFRYRCVKARASTILIVLALPPDPSALQCAGGGSSGPPCSAPHIWPPSRRGTLWQRRRPETKPIRLAGAMHRARGFFSVNNWWSSTGV